MEKVDPESLFDYRDRFREFKAKFGLEELDIDVALNFWEVMLEQKKGVVYVAKKVSDVVGCLFGSIYEDPETEKIVAEEFHWYVDETERNQGAGDDLLNNFEHWASTMGAEQILMGIDSKSKSDAVYLDDLYRERGYEPSKIIFQKEL